MNGRRTGFLVAGMFIASSWLMTNAKEPADPVAAETPAAPVVDTAAQEAAQKAAAQKIKRQRETLVQLNDTRWTIELAPMSGERSEQPKRKPTDTLSFSGATKTNNGQISSERLAKEGFEPSNFTLSVGDDNIPIWETMQSKPDGSNAFWRGELHGEKMSGILSRHAADGTAQDFSFVGQPAGAASVQAPTPAPAVTPAANKTAPAPTSTIPPAKKKKGWFGR